MRVRSESSHNFDRSRVLTEPSVQCDQDTATLFEDEIQTVDAKGSFWVRTLDQLFTFDVLITLLSASFEDVLQGFGTQVDS